MRRPGVKRYLKLIIGAVAIATVCELLVHRSVRLEGYIRNRSGEPLPGVLVMGYVTWRPAGGLTIGADAHPSGGRQIQTGAVTDQNGHFVIRNPSGDEVILQGVQKKGMQVCTVGNGVGGELVYDGNEIRGYSILG